jgi:hypothetical protein
VPSMHRKCSSDGRWSRIHGRSSGGVHREIYPLFSSESPLATAKRATSSVKPDER